MKREKPTYPKVKTIKPLFWKECRFCGREFKREKGYEIVDYTIVNPVLHTTFCCNECAKNIKEVKLLIEKCNIFPRPDRPKTI